jgi:hypothetical protein
MIGLLSELRLKWEEALASGAAGREWRAVALTVLSPVKLLAGIRDRDGRISLLVETSVQRAPKHKVRFEAEGISLVDERWADEGLVRIAVTLERSDLRDIFEVLVVDLISVATRSLSAEEAIHHLVHRVEAWQACLRARRRGLTREEQAGLLGELSVLELTAAEIGMPGAIAAWRGPLAGLHDFESAGIGIEVKAAIGASHHIRISRLDQLDTEGLGTLVLARARFQEAPEGRTLPEVIDALRKGVMERFPNATADFADKLMRTGYLDTDAEFYSLTRTVLQNVRAFAVSAGFPRLIGATVPAAIVEAAYSLDERQLSTFEIGEQDLRELLRRMVT